MKYLVYLFTIATLFTSCACKKNCCLKKEKAAVEATTEKKEMTDEERVAAIAKEMKKEKPINVAEDYHKMLAKEIPSNAVARIQRTNCFGRCPVYTMTVFEGGRVEYFGKRFTPREGRYEAQADEKTIEQLLAKAAEINFFGFNNTYDKEGITDLPSTLTTIRNEEGLKTVVNRFDAPENLISFEKYFDTLFEGLDWKPVSLD